MILRGSSVKCCLDDQKLFDVIDHSHPKGGIGLDSWVTMVEYKDIRVITPDGEVLYKIL